MPQVDVVTDAKAGKVVLVQQDRRAALEPWEAVELAARILAAARRFPPFDQLPRLPSSIEEIGQSWVETSAAILSDDPDALARRHAQQDAAQAIPVLAMLLPPVDVSRARDVVWGQSHG